VSRQERVSPEFDWAADFDHARDELESASSEAASALAQALNSAFHMADICQRAIARGLPGQASSATLADWQNFLERISNDAEFFYPMHLDLLGKGDSDRLQTRFENIAAVALDAQIQIGALTRPSLAVQKKAVVHLRELMKNLQAARAILDPSPEGAVTNLPAADNGEDGGGAAAAAAEEEEEEEEIPPPPEAALVPLVGRIAAGNPDLADETVEGIFPLPRQVVGEGDLFLLRVHGQSMTGAGIMEGDWVAIRQQPVAENGEIVVALIDGDATIKKYKKTEGKVWLLAQNPDYDYDEIPSERAIIVGKVVAVFRKM